MSRCNRIKFILKPKKSQKEGNHGSEKVDNTRKEDKRAQHLKQEGWAELESLFFGGKKRRKSNSKSLPTKEICFENHSLPGHVVHINISFKEEVGGWYRG